METNIELSIIQNIHEIRGVRVMLDFDLAKRYGVETRALNQAVKRNIRRFPGDFMFQLTQEEWSNLISQNVISSWGGTRKLPYAFTREGVAMLSGLLNSDIAIDTNILIMRAFGAIQQYAITYAEIKHDLNNFMRDTNAKFIENDTKFDTLFKLLDEFMEHKKELEKPRNPIGFRMNTNG